MNDFFAARRVVVTGGAGFLGSYVVDKLAALGCTNIFVPRSSQYDLTRVSQVQQMYTDFRPDIVIHLAAVVGGIEAKCCEAIDKNENEIVVWGDGSPSREFLYVEDAAEGILLAAERHNDSDPVNLGTGQEVRINELVSMIAGLTGYSGLIRYDCTKPNGQPRRGLDTGRAAEKFGFVAQTSLAEGLSATIDWYNRTLRKPPT